MNTLTLFKQVKAFVLDVDGVLTDGNLLLLDDGQQAKTHVYQGRLCASTGGKKDTWFWSYPEASPLQSETG